MVLSRKQLQELKELTRFNNHTEARLVLACYINHHGLKEAYRNIKELQKFFHIVRSSHHLNLLRNDLDAILFNVAANKIKNFQQVNKCF